MTQILADAGRDEDLPGHPAQQHAGRLADARFDEVDAADAELVGELLDGGPPRPPGWLRRASRLRLGADVVGVRGRRECSRDGVDEESRHVVRREFGVELGSMELAGPDQSVVEHGA